MEKKYAVNDFMTGRLVTVDTQEEAIQLFWDNVVKFIKLQYGNVMYVEMQRDGDIYRAVSDNVDTFLDEKSPLSSQEILQLFNNGEVPISFKIPSIRNSVGDVAG